MWREKMLGAPNALLAPSRLLMLAILAVVGSQRDALAGSDPESCPTSTLAATTTTGDPDDPVGASLVQQVSLSRKIAAGMVKEEPAERAGRNTVQFQQKSDAGPMAAPLTRATSSNTTTSNDSFAEGRPLANGSAARMAQVPSAATIALAAGARENVTRFWQIVETNISDVSYVVVGVLDGVVEAVYRRLGFKTSPSLSTRRIAGVVIFLVLASLFLLVAYLILSRPASRGMCGTAITSRSPAMSSRHLLQPGGVFSPSLDHWADPGVFDTLSRSRSTKRTMMQNDGLTRSPSSSETEEFTDRFCPDLVVPEQCECMLMVPVYAPSGSFSICDMNGRTVLHAKAQTKASPQGAHWQLTLHTITGEALAHCVEARGGSIGSGMEFHILDAKGERFGNIFQLQGQQRFEFVTVSGLKLNLWGNFQTQAVNVTDVHGSLLATTEPCGADFDQTGNYYNLRVAPLANVGYSLCALLCIGQILRAGRREPEARV